jgi:hypothetical protein
VSNFRIYAGKRIDGMDAFGNVLCEVTVDGNPLPPDRFANQGTQGTYDWGNPGGGAKSLAHSLLDYDLRERGFSVKDAELWADRMYQQFTMEVVAGWSAERAEDAIDPLPSDRRNEWTISSDELWTWIQNNYPEIK